MYSACYFCFHQTRNVHTHFSKNPKYEISQKKKILPAEVPLFHAEGGQLGSYTAILIISKETLPNYVTQLITKLKRGGGEEEFLKSLTAKCNSFVIPVLCHITTSVSACS
jgi:hypothetical protein